MQDQDEYKAMLFDRPERIPVRCSILPAAWIKYREKLDEVVASYPELFGEQSDSHNQSARRNYDEVSGTYVAGAHTDAWGCVWENVHTGRNAIVTKHPVPDRHMIHDLQVPDEDIGLPHGFMYLRLQDLRGFEELMIDFAEEPPELQLLIDKVLEYNLRQVDRKLADIDATGQIVYFGDDLGMQNSLPMSPDTWRLYLKPCFQRIYAPVKKAGHYIYMHTDGHIHEIIMDLKECGVDIINPQTRANGLDNLRRVCKRKICVALDLDRQLFPFCGPDDIDAHIREAVEMLGSPEGGLWLQAEVDDGVPLENIDAVCKALVKYSSHFSG